VYQFVDRPVACLDKGCRFLVWSMRSWTLLARARQCPGPALAPAFAKWRMIGGLQPFLRLMLTLDRDSLDTMRFCSLNCQRISEHEAILLALSTSAARGEMCAVRDTLALLIGEDAIGDALGALAALCTALEKAGIAPHIPDDARM
jgi:hypothetical protein